MATPITIGTAGISGCEQRDHRRHTPPAAPARGPRCVGLFAHLPLSCEKFGSPAAHRSRLTPHVSAGCGRFPAVDGRRNLLCMLGFRRNLTMIDAADALARPRPGDAGTRAPRGTRHAAAASLPRGPREAVVAMGCFWGAERVFWQAPGVYTTAVGYAGGFTPNPPTRRSARGAPGTPRRSWSCSTRRRPPTTEILRLFWENHDPTQGMRQGNDVGTQYRSAIYYESEEQRAAAERLQGCLRREPARRRIPTDHDRDRQGGPVLLRRGLPPAVPRQEPRTGHCGGAARGEPA